MAEKAWIGYLLKGSHFSTATGSCSSLEEAIRTVESNFRDPRSKASDHWQPGDDYNLRVYQGSGDQWNSALVEFRADSDRPMMLLALYKIIEVGFGEASPVTGSVTDAEGKLLPREKPGD